MAFLMEVSLSISNSDMKRFIKYILVVILGVVVVDLANRVLYTIAFTHVPHDSEVNVLYKYQLNTQKAEIVILGASKALYNYNPKVLKDSFNCPVYNYGMEGTSIVGQYLCLIKSYELGSVNTVILDLSNSQLQEEWVEERISRYNNYYMCNDSVKAVVDDIMGRKSLMLYSSLYQFNSHLHDFIWLYGEKRTDIDGYVALPYTGNEVHVPRIMDKEVFVIYPKAKEYLDKIVSLCKKHGSRLVLCVSPSLFNDSSFDNYINDYCTQHSLEFFNLRNCPKVNLDKKLYKDLSHLNGRGAVIFTKELVSKLKSHPTDLNKSNN